MDKFIVGFLVVLVILAGVFLYFDKYHNVDNSQNMATSTPDVVDDDSVDDNDDSIDESSTSTDPEEQEDVEQENVEEIAVDSEFYIEGRDDFSFSLNELRVKQGERVRITFKNVGDLNHNLRIEDSNLGTSVLQNGEEESLEFVADTRGNVTYYCSVGSHRQNGMVGTIIIE